MNSWSALVLGNLEGDGFVPKYLANIRQILNERGHVAEPQLGDQADRPFGRFSGNFEQLEGAIVKAQPVHRASAGPGRKLLNECQPQNLLIEVEAGIDVAGYNSNVQRLLCPLHHVRSSFINDTCDPAASCRVGKRLPAAPNLRIRPPAGPHS